MASGIYIEDSTGYKIELEYNIPVIIGRGCHNIESSKAHVSRKHVQLILNQDNTIELSVLGLNPVSYINHNIDSNKHALTKENKTVLNINDHFFIDLSISDARKYTIRSKNVNYNEDNNNNVNELNAVHNTSHDRKRSRSISPFPELPANQKLDNNNKNTNNDAKQNDNIGNVNANKDDRAINNNNANNSNNTGNVNNNKTNVNNNNEFGNNNDVTDVGRSEWSLDIYGPNKRHRIKTPAETGYHNVTDNRKYTHLNLHPIINSNKIPDSQPPVVISSKQNTMDQKYDHSPQILSPPPSKQTNATTRAATPTSNNNNNINNVNNQTLTPSSAPFSQIHNTPPSINTNTASPTSNKKDPGQFTLAFPCLSVGDLQFDAPTAVRVMLQCISQFLSNHTHERLRLVCVTDSEDSEVARLVNEYKSQHEMDIRFILHIGDLLLLKSEGIPCSYIVNVSDWTFSAKGTRKRLHEAAGKTGLLQSLSQQQYTAAKPFVAYPVRLPHEPAADKQKYSQLQEEGVKCIIHIVPPNFNPNRPDCFPKDQLNIGIAKLKQSYEAIFTKFYESTGLPPALINKKNTNNTNIKPIPVSAVTPVTNLGNTLASMTTNDYNNNNTNNDTKVDLTGEDNEILSAGNDVTTSNAPIYKHPNRKPTFNAGINALLAYLKPPSQRAPSLKEDVYWEDKDLVCIYDKYPKSQVHLLLMPRITIASITKVNKSHLTLLKQMHSRAEWIVRCLLSNNNTNSASIRCGYHATPSMTQLHMHIISQDFNSVWMKSKKHWNSFTTEFFIPSYRVIQDVEDHGLVSLSHNANKCDELIKGALTCHRSGCGTVIKTMDKLKEHIQKCKCPLPTDD